MSLVGVGWSGNGGVGCLVDEFETGLPEVNRRGDFLNFCFAEGGVVVVVLVVLICALLIF